MRRMRRPAWTDSKVTAKGSETVDFELMKFWQVSRVTSPPCTRVFPRQRAMPAARGGVASGYREDP